MKKISIFVFAVVLLLIAAVPLLAEGVWPAWNQFFEQDAGGWITDDLPGPGGWCGDITHYELGSGPAAPSAGHGYAVAAHGECNDYYDDAFPAGSGPYAPWGGYSASWPQSGYVSELDIYLDPAWDSGSGSTFRYYVSMRLLDVNEFRYYVIPVTKSGSDLLVDGYPVGEAGWYTFRLRFGEDSGQLTVDFELAQHGQIIYSQPLTTTAFYGQQTSSFSVSNIGTGYSWLDLTAGEEVAIDQHLYRPGR